MSTATPTEAALRSVAIGDLSPSPNNPRFLDTNNSAFDELVASIKALGILEPPIGRPHPDPAAAAKGKIELCAGHRRYAAAIEAGLTHIPVIVRDLDERAALEITVTENLHRANLHPLEEARGIALLVSKGWELKSIAEHLGKPADWVQRRRSISGLVRCWQKEIENPKRPARDWPVGHLERIARLPSSTQERLFEAMSVKTWRGSQLDAEDPPTLRELNEQIAHHLRDLSAAPWKLDDATLQPKAGACASCTKRSGAHASLFPEIAAEKKKHDYCLDAACWHEKTEALIQIRIDGVKADGRTPVLAATGYLGPQSAKALKEKYGQEINHHGDLQQVKRTDPKAKPVVIVEGNLAGHLLWAKPASDGPRRSESAPAKPKSNPVEVATRKVQRKALVMHLEALELLNEKMKPAASKWQQAVIPSGFDRDRIVKAALFFGVDDAWFETSWDLLERPIQGGTDCVYAALFVSLIAMTFPRRLDGNPNDTARIAEHMEECRRQATWLGWNFSDTLTRAADHLKANDKV